MIDWNRWLPGLGQDEPEEEDAVTKTLRALGQVPDALGDIGRSAGQSVVGAVQGATQAVADAYAVPTEQRPPQYRGPSYAQPSLGPGEQSTAERLPGMAQAGIEGAGAMLGDRGAMLAGLTPPQSAMDVIEQAAPAPVRGLQIGREALRAAGGAAFEAAPQTTDPLFTTNEIQTPLGTIPSMTGPTPQQAGRFVGEELADPTNYLNFGAAGRAADAPVGEALGAVGRRVRGALAGNVERMAAADARMVAEGSTLAPAGLGALPEPGGARRGLPTVEVLQERLDTATAAWRRATASGDDQMAALARERAVELQSDLADARNARLDLEPAITSDVGRPVNPLALTEESADDLHDAMRPREVVRGTPSDLSGPVGVPVDMSGRANASAGAAPNIPGTGVLPAANRALSEGIAGGVGGAVIEQGRNPDEDPRTAAARGFAAGAVGFPLATRGARGLARLAGAAPSPGGGALGVFGGRPANEAAAAAPNPIMQRMAQQMAGQHAPSGVTNKRGLGEWWAQAMTDDRAGLRHFQDAVSRSIGRPLSASESVAELTRVNPASVASQRIDEGLKAALQNVGDDEDYLAQYLVHSHNVDVAREIGQQAHDAAIAAGRTPQQASQAAMRAANTRQFSGDLRLGETLQQLTDIEQRVKSLPDGAARWQDIQDAGQAVWDFNKQTLERKRDAGIISDDLFSDLTTKYPKYVRTDIADYFDKGTGGPAPAGKRLGVSDIGIQKISAAGTAKERVNPLLSTIDQTYSAEASIARNEAGKAFEELTRLDPAWQSTFKEVVPAQGVNIGNPTTTVPASYTLKNGEQFLRVWDGGQARTYVIPEEYAALVAPQTGRVLGDSGAAKAAQGAMNIYKSLITSKNPAFSMLVSPLRDAGDYAIREATLSAKDQGIKGAVQAVGALPGVMADYAKAIPDAFAGILQGTYKGDLGRMMKEGAGQISRPGRDQGELRAALGELQRTNGLEVKTTGDLMKLVGNVLTLGAEPIGGRIEQIPRLAAARRAAGRGASDLGQAMSFRDATVDFQRAGEWSRVINSVVPFFNVAMQGGAQTVRTFKANPAAFMASVAGTVGTATMAAEAWNNADPQRAADYEDVPDYLKRTGLVVMLPGVEGQSARGDALPNYVWIPVGQYGALVQTAKEAAKNAVAGKPGADLGSFSGWGELGAEVAGIFSPIRGDSAGGMVSSLIPPGLSTAAELSANRDLFRGSTIATESKNEQASALSQGSAAVANAITGQETQPSQWEYLYKDLGGYGATLALEASNLAAEKLGMRPPKADERPIQAIPVVGGLVNRVVRDAGGQRLEDATGDVSRVPESIRPILAEVGMRRDQLAPVGSRYRGATLSREEQERWQSTVNAYIQEDVLAVRDSAAWDDPTKRKQAVEQAVTKAKARAAKDSFDLTDADLRERIEREQSRKAG